MERQELLDKCEKFKEGDLTTVWVPYYFHGITNPHGSSRPAIRVSHEKYGSGKLVGGLSSPFTVKEMEKILDVRKGIIS